MPPPAQAHMRSHCLLLLQKLLNLRDSAASPLTLVLDSLEQPGTCLLREFAIRAKVSGSKVILVSFSTARRPRGVDVLVSGRGKELQRLRDGILKHYPASKPKEESPQSVLVLFDTLNPLATTWPSLLPAFLSGIISPVASAVAIYHQDIPFTPTNEFDRHEPHPLSVLSHLATAIFRLSSLHHEVERQRARNRSLQEPEFGLTEGQEGILVGLKGRAGSGQGYVLEMEMRRRSGRAVIEKFVLLPGEDKGGLASLSLLKDHEEFRAPDDEGHVEEEPESTFNLGLTEKQRRDRERVVLPYFDAQTDIGGGEGGRILYEMGREDDFDEEDDDI